MERSPVAIVAGVFVPAVVLALVLETVKILLFRRFAFTRPVL
jgi:hypothetical protein